MRKVFLLVIIFTSSLSLNAQYQGYKPVSNLQDFKQNFSAASQKINSIKSDFVQEKNVSMLAEKIVSKGKFWYKKNNLVRMEYTQPFTYLMIINSDNIYLKDDQKTNTVSTRSNKLFQQINNLMVDCVKGNVLNNTDFNVRVFENNQSYLIELSPANKALKEIGISHTNFKFTIGLKKLDRNAAE